MWLRGGERVVIDVTDTGDPRDREQLPAAVAPAAPKPAAHQAAVARLQAAYAAIPPGRPIRLAKRTSNLFRFREAAGARTGPGDGTGVSAARGAPGLDVSAFGRVLSVDPQSRTAVTGGMTTYEDLADATLRHSLMPLVVPQLKTITIGGAVTGLGIESSSLRSGMPHESVIEMEILTGDGRVVTAAPGNEHDALYRGFPNSYGTLGYALSLTIELEPVTPYVHLRHFRFSNPDDCMDAVATIAAEGSLQGHRADFVDGTAFSLDEMYLTVGSFSEVAPWLSDYTRERVYYQSIRGPHEDFLTIRDYLWRWDTDWFWCSRPFGVQRPLIRRLWPRRYRRSDVYRKLVALDRKHGLSAALNAGRRAPQHEDVIQDVEIPVERGAEFLRSFAADVGMNPVWMCPLRLRGDRTWPLYPLEPHQVYVNFGFWGTVPLPPGQTNGYYNRLVEELVTALGGHKGLYSTSFYSAEDFWALYNGQAFAALKSEYDPAGRLAGLYDKCVRGH
jgi:FAD/FMN-containing dehydrogenase